MASTIKLNRDQLYAMAALSSFGERRQAVISFDLFDQDTGVVVMAVQVRENVPEQRLKDAHDNGWAYYEIPLAGAPKPLTEEELEEIR